MKFKNKVMKKKKIKQLKMLKFKLKMIFQFKKISFLKTKKKIYQMLIMNRNLEKYEFLIIFYKGYR